MCKCIMDLVKKGCVERSWYQDTNGIMHDNGFFLHGTDKRKVLAGCEKINYCPICKSNLSKDNIQQEE